MTRDEILALEAGRELDALVAEKVMGWTWGEYSPPVEGPSKILRPPESWAPSPDRAPGSEVSCPGWHFRVPQYSTDIAAAWEVVEKMVPIKYGFNLAIESPPGPWGDWEVHFYNGGTHLAFADTAPLAICRAALLAVMEVEG